MLHQDIAQLCLAFHHPAEDSLQFRKREFLLVDSQELQPILDGRADQQRVVVEANGCRRFRYGEEVEPN